ncbi:MAG: energy transducer TonB [Blastocatellia bacterium]
MASEWEQGIPACVEATAILPDDRKIVVQILVGSFKQGLSMTTRFHFAVVENDTQFQSVKLSELPQFLREPLSVKRPNEGKRLNVVTLPPMRLAGAPRFYYSKSSAPFGSLEMMQVGTADEPPPMPTSPVRVSTGVIQSEALTRVHPIYPSIAKQINASGDVQVEIVIDEQGRVISAKAISGHPVLRSAAEDAARKWTFKPTLLDKKPVKQPGVLTFKFVPPK